MRLRRPKGASIFRFTIRGMMLVTVIVALAIGWWFDHKRLQEKIDEIAPLVQQAGTIEGRVIYGDSGKPASGIRVQAQVIGDPRSLLAPPATHVIRTFFGQARTDENGHYKF